MYKRYDIVVERDFRNIYIKQKIHYRRTRCHLTALLAPSSIWNAMLSSPKLENCPEPLCVCVRLSNMVFRSKSCDDSLKSKLLFFCTASPDFFSSSLAIAASFSLRSFLCSLYIHLHEAYTKQRVNQQIFMSHNFFTTFKLSSACVIFSANRPTSLLGDRGGICYSNLDLYR